MLTERSCSSVVMPRIVNCNGFFAKGASMMIGSIKYPTERDKGHSCVIGPPEMIPGLRSMAVPLYIKII